MQAIILATGETNPLPPLTEAMPSPMLPLVNRPVMVYAVEMLARQGFKQIFISLHSHADEIEGYFGTGRRWGVTLNYLLQRDAWGTAGALRWAGNQLTELFIVLPADALVDVNLAELIDQHMSRRPQATVVVTEASCMEIGVEGQSETMRVGLSCNGVVSRAGSNGVHSDPWIDTGVYVFEPGVVNLIPARTQVDIHRHLLPSMLATGMTVDSYRFTGYWNRLDTFQKLHEAQRVYLYSAWGNHASLAETLPLRFPVVDGRQVAPGIWVGRNHTIHPHARLAPPVYIGEYCQIGKGVELGPEAIVGDYVMIDDDATICQSTILEQTYVGELVNLEKRMVSKSTMIDFDTGQSLKLRDPFLLAAAPISVVRTGLRELFNRSVALLLLLVWSPVLIVLGFLMLISTGKVFQTSLRQRIPPGRAGEEMSRDGSTFNLLRFNTRRANGRVTRLGKWLESWEGERLLEPWNVLMGDMLLVGIMPMDPKKEAGLTAPRHHKVRDYYPGITGLWYIEGAKGNKISDDEIIVVDAFYVATRTWMKDLSLFLRTPAAWMRRLREG